MAPRSEPGISRSDVTVLNIREWSIKYFFLQISRSIREIKYFPYFAFDNGVLT